MRGWVSRLTLVLLALVLFPRECPAPLIYRPGEGWVYEAPGSEGDWTRQRARDQLEVARQALEKEDYGLALKAARRVVRVWPLSDSAAEAQYLVARAYEGKGRDEKAFKEYQKLLKQYPKYADYQEVLEKQFEIACRYLDGKWFRLLGFIPFFPNMDRTAKMFEQIVESGPYSPIAPQAQMNIGTAREKQVSFFNRVDPFREAIDAYVVAADRYLDEKEIASDAIFKIGMAYYRQAEKADYDQTMAAQAMATFNDFIVLYPDDRRVPEARELISQMRTEQARGNYNIARFYDKRRKWAGAMIYYNETWVRDPQGPYAEAARRRLEELKVKTGTSTVANGQPSPAAPFP